MNGSRGEGDGDREAWPPDDLEGDSPPEAEGNEPLTVDELPPVPMREFLERSPARLLVEAAVGAAGGAALSLALPGAALGVGGFALAGALAAPLALVLTPTSGSLTYRAVRYGLGLALPVTLAVSFIAGADGVLVEELLVLGVVLFCIGAVGHGIVTRALDGAEPHQNQEDRSP